MHLHLNLAGGLSGDMFIAAVLDAFPQFEGRVSKTIDALDAPYPVECSLVSHSDYDMTGRRFEVEPFDKYFGHIPFAFPVLSHGDSIAHEHTTWGSVRQRLREAQIEPSVRTHAMSVFELLIEAEAGALDVEPDKVAFQEVGAWDAIAEIVGAAALIDGLGAVRWTASPLPFGERVTPTGAAIVSYLCPPTMGMGALPHVRALVASGTGFGTRSSSVNSHLRLLCFDEESPPVRHRDMTHLSSRITGRVNQ